MGQSQWKILGDISGTSIATFATVIHADGSGNIHDEGAETATVLGRTGTFSFSASITFTSDGSDSGQFVIRDGTGGLDGIHGAVAVHTPTIGSPFDVYSGQVHFDPS